MKEAMDCENDSLTFEDVFCIRTLEASIESVKHAFVQLLKQNLQWISTYESWQ